MLNQNEEAIEHYTKYTGYSLYEGLAAALLQTRTNIANSRKLYPDFMSND